jgi:hypothetical protein
LLTELQATGAARRGQRAALRTRDPRAATVTVSARSGDAFDEGRTLASGRIESRVLPGLAATVEQILAR